MGKQKKAEEKKSILCKLGLHSWEQNPPALHSHFQPYGIKRCVRPGCGKSVGVFLDRFGKRRIL